MNLRSRRKAVVSVLLFAVLILAAGYSLTRSISSVRITSHFGIASDLPSDFVVKGLMGSVEIRSDASVWDRLIRLQRVEYGDPRFEVVDCWIINRPIGAAWAGNIDLAEYQPIPFEGENLHGGRSIIAIILHPNNDFKEVSLPAEFEPVIRVHFTFLGRKYVVAN